MISRKTPQERISIERDFEQLDILYELHNLSCLLKHSRVRIRQERNKKKLEGFTQVILQWEQSERELKAKSLPEFDFHALTREAKKLQKQISRWKCAAKDSVGKLAIHKAKIECQYNELRENLEHVKTSAYYYFRFLSNKALSLLERLDQAEELKEKGKILKRQCFHLNQKLNIELDLILKKKDFLSNVILKDENVAILLDG